MLTRHLLFLFLPTYVFSQSSTAPSANPTTTPCPNTALVRSVGGPSNQSLSPSEQAYVSARTSNVLPGAWQSYLKTANASAPSALPGYISTLLSNSSTYPHLGIAVSGGGYRAALFGAGVLSALDGRNETATSNKTGSGGLLQAAEYLSGLSGGSWLVTALAQANFPTIPELLFPSSSQDYGGFLAQFDLVAPGPTAQDTLSYLQLLVAESREKHNATGLPITVTDPWSRALARHFVNGTTAKDILQNGTHGSGLLFSDIANVPTFQAHEQPFLLVTVNSIPPNPNVSQIIPGNSVPLTSEIWEFNVYESGSFDPSLGSFIPTSLLGSTNGSCIKGFDQAAYVAGISSNLFNGFNISAKAIQSSPIGPLISLVQAAFPDQPVRLDSAAVPNPFKGVNPSTYTSTNESFLSLVDGGSNGEVIPLQPLLVRARGVDTIIAIDASADTADSFSNGTDLINTAKRATLLGSQYPFPSVPATADAFVSQGLTSRPTFFGCNDSTETPLVIYIANGARPGAVTNTSTFQTTYEAAQIRAFIDQTFQFAVQGIPTNTSNSSALSPDPQWGACLACAVVDRARARAGLQREGVCADCFGRYCWNVQGDVIGGNGTTGTGSGSTAGGGGKNAAGRVRVELGLMVGLVGLLSWLV